MKIDGMGARSSMAVPDHETAGRVGKTANPFAAELVHNEGAYSRERMDDLLAKIDRQGARLSQTPTYAELKKYRELVRAFVGEAVAHMYSAQTQTGWDRHGRQKVYTTVKKVDETLAGMTEDVRLGQEKRLDIVAKHDAIRGMLVDLYL